MNLSRRLNIVIPVKGIQTGKSRLASALNLNERIALNKHLIEHTLSQTTNFNNTAKVYVVSPDKEVQNLVASKGAQFIQQRAIGLNAGLAEAIKFIKPCATLFLAVDLPNLSMKDIEGFFCMSGIKISPDEKESGTNALLVPKPNTIAFRFGPNSFDLHLTEALKSGIETATVRTPGLQFDLDTIADLARMKDWKK
tara:strand:+ start:1498 stop:2085 length:588 start_codon:yes stop_codon:yes gene_type:complete